MFIPSGLLRMKLERCYSVEVGVCLNLSVLSEVDKCCTLYFSLVSVYSIVF